MLKNASLESQGHTGVRQNFDPFEGSGINEEGGASDEGLVKRSLNIKKYRVELDVRTLIAAVLMFLLIMVAGVTFAWTASAAQITDSGISPKSITSEVLPKKEVTSEDLSCPIQQPPAGIIPEQAVSADGVVNLNLATLQDLQTLKGVGPAMAQKILDYRAENGNFKRKEDLMEIKGVGDATYDKLKDKIKV